MSLTRHYPYTNKLRVSVSLLEGYARATRGELVQARLIFPQETDATLAVISLQRFLDNTQAREPGSVGEKIISTNIPDSRTPNKMDALLRTGDVVVPKGEMALPRHIDEAFRICYALADFVIATAMQPAPKSTEQTE